MSAEQMAKLEVGDVLEGRYEIIRDLGVSGCAETYEARQLNIDRTVTVRVMNIVLVGTGSQAIGHRFAEEVELATHLSDPGIVTVFDLGVTEVGLPYVVTEPASGPTLKNYLAANGYVEPLRAVGLLIPCLESLAKAHQHGLLHRDLKPDNLTITRAGAADERLMILGFGLAALGADSEGRLTHFGLRHDNHRYMAPETISSGPVSAAIDVYQLGLVLVEMIVGGRLFPEDNPYLCCKRQLTGDLGVPDVLMASLLGPVLERALDRDVTQRFQSAGEFRDALVEVMRSPAAGSLVQIAGAAALLGRMLPDRAREVYSVDDWSRNLGDSAGRVEEVLVHANDDWVVEVSDGVEPGVDLDFDALCESSAFADLSGFIFPARLESLLTRNPLTHPAPEEPDPAHVDDVEDRVDLEVPMAAATDLDGASSSRSWLAAPDKRRDVGSGASESNLMGRENLPFSGLAYEEYLDERKRRGEEQKATDVSPARAGPTTAEFRLQARPPQRSSFPAGLVVAGVVLAIAVVALFFWLTTSAF